MTALTTAEAAARAAMRAKKPAAIAKTERYAEKLAHGESVAMIQLQWGYQCNIACTHCSISTFQGRRPPESTPLTLDKLRSVFDEADALGLAQVTISGGEPLIFKDLFDVIRAIGAHRFIIQVDTNGWYLSPEMAQRLQEAGVDKLQISLDSLLSAEHDAFRRAPGSWERATAAMAHAAAVGIPVQVSTVVTRQRIRTAEFCGFLNFARNHGYTVAYLWPKLTGEWEGAADALPRAEDVAYMQALAQDHPLLNRGTWYGIDVGCNAVKRMVTLTQTGELFPCHWMYWSLGNVWEQPLGDLLAKGMAYFGPRSNICRVSQDQAFIDKYVTQTFGRTSVDPILTIETVMGTPEEFHRHLPVLVV